MAVSFKGSTSSQESSRWGAVTFLSRDGRAVGERTDKPSPFRRPPNLTGLDLDFDTSTKASAEARTGPEAWAQQYVRTLDVPNRLALAVRLFDELLTTRDATNRERLAAMIIGITTAGELLELGVATHVLRGNDDRIRWAVRLVRRKGPLEAFQATRQFLTRRPELAIFFAGLANDEDLFSAEQRGELLTQLASLEDEDVDEHLLGAVRMLPAREAHLLLNCLVARQTPNKEAIDMLAELEQG